jgi:hypothetical protein
LISRPDTPFAAKMNVTRQHHDIRVGHGDFDCSEFKVQIGQNV